MNYAAMGASAVYDARFLALADNDPVSSWTDRSASANNATQTGSERPTFKTNQFNGQPGVGFTAAGQSSLVLTNSIAISSVGAILTVTRKTSSGNRLFSLTGSTSAATCQVDYSDNFIYIFNSAAGTGSRTSDTFSAGTSRIFLGSASDFILINGVNQGLVSVSATISQVNTIGRRASEYSDGQIGLIAYFGSALSSAARKRAQHAAAYSFKIACS